MIAKPEASCPRCGSRFNVMDTVDVSEHAQTVTYYAECDCGAANLTVEKGTVTEIIPRNPLDVPEYFDEPTPLEYEEYLAQ